MQALLYWTAAAALKVVEALPLGVLARLGRAVGALFYAVDARHRRVAQANLALCFGRERSPRELRTLVREHFRRLGENSLCALKTATMPWPRLKAYCEIIGAERLLPQGQATPPPSRVVALGHFGNFELFARLAAYLPAFRCATTYRGISPPALNRLLLERRRRSGCLFFERRGEGGALRALLHTPGVLLGLLADQAAGRRGLSLPFLGHLCEVSPAPAVLALRYRCPLHTAICYRVGLARWRLEIGEEIPTVEDGRRRPVEAIMRDVNAAFEAAIRRDPANWFWVHNRWKNRPPRRRPAVAAAAAHGGPPPPDAG